MSCLSDSRHICAYDPSTKPALLVTALVGVWLAVCTPGSVAQAESAGAGPVPTATASVPVRDLRHVRTEVAETSAARVSGASSKIVLICYGNDDVLCKEVRSAAGSSLAEGEPPVAGIIRAKGSRGVAIYGQGFPLETHDDPGQSIESQTILAIRRVRAQIKADASGDSGVATR